jgi:3-oxoacyl-[acyl-carrier protein] reductase
VAGRQDRDAGLGKQQFGVEAALVERGAQDRDVGGAAADRGGRSAGVAEQDVHPRHPRIPGAPLHDRLDQVGAGARLDGDTETAGLGSPPAGAFERGTDSLDRNPPLLEQHGAGRGQGDPAAGPLEQRHTELALELADGRRQRRLGHAQARRGPGEVQLLRDRDEIPELAQLDLIHTRSVWSDSQRILPCRASRQLYWLPEVIRQKGVAMDSMNRLAGKMALVTGGSRGIGAEIVRRLAGEGADVGFTYHTGKDQAQQVAAEVRGLGRRTLTIQADLAEPASAAAVVTAVTGEFGTLDILVNNAGITHWGLLAKTSLEDFDRLVAVNARAPFLMMQAAADRLADGGRVVNISSGVTSTALAGIALYSGVKAFLDQVTKVAAAEFAARGITVNAVGPGSTATGPFGQLTAAQRDEAGASFALGRLGEPADTAGLVAFLASDDAGFITGQIIYNSGGQRGPIRWTR